MYVNINVVIEYTHRQDQQSCVVMWSWKKLKLNKVRKKIKWKNYFQVHRVVGTIEEDEVLACWKNNL